MSAKIRGKLLILHRKTENDDENTICGHNIHPPLSPRCSAIGGESSLRQGREIPIRPRA